MISSLVGRRGVTVRVPAKINLELRVGPLRPDGYHDLATVFHAVDLVDHVTVRRSQDWRVTVAGVDADGVPIDDSNLALAAARLLAQAYPDEAEPVHLHIDKQIPVAGGWPVGRRTRPPRCWRVTRCGVSVWASRGCTSTRPGWVVT
ncbi:hypothetical protein [Mobilicoccus caccae]|uniref:4-diphosphocytidyl-2-C-methyl-D-erythritol kinase n=1 Tax=Mobilicoccus caccae TaxID=1859295 RepID=A0ABQ6ITF3_9MICO|nr:hypothetical protein GCM10025883_28040 [Mobilicoccus caccae]